MASLTVADAAEVLQSASQPRALVEIRDGIDRLARLCHAAAVMRGWWQNPKTKEFVKLNFGERVALMHRELGEALEAARTDAHAEHIEGFSGVEEEFVDELIRLFDTAGALDLSLGDAFLAKFNYNLRRQDHSPSTRLAAGGKEF